MKNLRLPVLWLVGILGCLGIAAPGPAWAQQADAPSVEVVDAPAPPPADAASEAKPSTEIVQHVVGPVPASVDPGPTWSDPQRVDRQRQRYRSLRIAGAVLLVIGLVTPPVVFVGLSAGEDCTSEGDLCGLGTAVGTLGAVAGSIPLIIGGGLALGMGRRRGRDLELQAPRLSASRHGVALQLGTRF